MTKPKTPVLLAIPTRRFRDPEKDLPEHLKAAFAILANRNLPWTFDVMVFGGGNVARGRNKIASDFLRGPWKWIFFWDDDMFEDPNLIADYVVRILSHRKHVCGGIYTTKEDDGHWVLNCFTEALANEAGLLPVPELGTGFKCFHRSVFETVAKKVDGLEYRCDDTGNPEWAFFQMGLKSIGGRKRWLPEDYWFDATCRECGIPIFADTAVKLRHRDVDGVLHPAGDWPKPPGPRKPAPLPPLVEDMPRAERPAGRFVVCLQYWQGDRAAAMRLANYIAAIEPVYRDDVELRFVVRHDAEAPDIETCAKVAQKMRLSIRIVPIHEVGYPASPNYMAVDTLQDAARWTDVWGVMLMEADCVPIFSDWLNDLMDEWAKARKAGKLVMGSWRDENGDLGHVNGNMIFDPKLTEKQELPACPPDKPWDIFYPPYFAPHWCRTGLIRNRYKEMMVPLGKLVEPECGRMPPVVIHGVKDGSVWEASQKSTGVSAPV